MREWKTLVTIRALTETNPRRGRATAPSLPFCATLLLVACGRELADSLEVADANAQAYVLLEPDVLDGCVRDADCGEGYCAGPAGCDAVWACQTETACSAAAPFVACTCRGVRDYVSSGCPGERWGYADWTLPEYF
ncbi:MAG: hypothetical protein ACJAYU_001415 [Bradymonadia bacterium]|jgi:hypothetical protein